MTATQKNNKKDAAANKKAHAAKKAAPAKFPRKDSGDKNKNNNKKEQHERKDNNSGKEEDKKAPQTLHKNKKWERKQAPANDEKSKESKGNKENNKEKRERDTHKDKGIHKVADEKEKEKDEEAAPSIDIDRVKQVSLNQKISQHASRKELQQARELYEEALREELANSHTFGAMVNAAVRCGDMSLAESVIVTMLEKGRKLKDVVLYTTLMKGYCAQGNLCKALVLFQDLLKKLAVVQPNIRTINTLLRGCVQMGEGHVAEALLAHTQKELKIKPDVSSWEYLLTLLSQGLLVDKMLPIVGRLRGEQDMQSGLPSMLVNLARAAALSGDYKLAKKTLQQATAILDSVASESIAAIASEVMANQGEEERERERDSVTNANKSVLGGKRAWKSQGETTLSTDERRNQSLLLYREHIREEWKQEAQTLAQFVDARQADSSSPSLPAAERALQFLAPFFPHMLSFDAHPVYPPAQSTSSIFTATPTQGDDVSAAALRDQLFLAICFKFGLDALVKRSSGHHCSELLAAAPNKEQEKEKEKEKKSSSSASSTAVPSFVDLLGRAPAISAQKLVDKSKSEKFISFVSQLQSMVHSFVCDDGTLCFEKIFSPSTVTPLSGSPSAQESVVVNASQPIKLEVCSGAGEWAVTQAKNDPTSPWVTLELRHDRVYQTATKMIYAEARNLCVLGGDAMAVLPRHFPPQSVGHLFVNHPEPPQQTGGETSEGHHLLNEDFFKEIERLLIENGMCTIVTDNLWYGKFLCRLLSLQTSLRLRSLTAKDSSLIGSGWMLQHEMDNVVLWVGDPGKEAGQVVDASSYFDRLWKRGQLEERYFIVLVKSSTYIRKVTKAPLKIPSVQVKKSIKFDDEEEEVEVSKDKKKVHDEKHSKDSDETVESILNAIKRLEQSDASLTTISDKKKNEKKGQPESAKKGNNKQQTKAGDKAENNSKSSRKRENEHQGGKKAQGQDGKKKKRY